MPSYFQFVLTLMNGLTYGALLFAIASGFTLVFGLMRVLNLSHGAIYLLGAYVGYTVSRTVTDWVTAWLPALGGVGWVAGVCGAGLAGALIALVLQRLIRGVDGELPQTLLTLGLAITIGDLCLWIWGGLPLTLEPPEAVSQAVRIAGIPYPGYRVFVIAFALFIGVALYLLLFRSQLGRIIRAGVDNREMVAATGVDIDRLFLKVFMLGGALTGVSGAIGGSYLAFQPGTDFEILTIALFVVVIGGLGSLLGSAVGAVIVGLIDSFGRAYFSELSMFLLSGTVILVLAFRTQGLFGRSVERG
ncbi:MULTISPECIES: branched-chain amino acid ABC transporter permease [Arhodomonas]|uniref:branched-chain amino acid ABC transporter permease n=1 Tax=Arhodomonas TaxID=2368 RepID=UPI000375BAEA|nr:branched-chain amino acid ABC transporter permease [Arhodomonas aquaeolei]